PAEAMRRLIAYGWPGNVRELENVVERAVILSPDRDLLIPSELLPSLPQETATADAGSAVAAAPASSEPTVEPTSMEEIERQHIANVLKQAGWRIEGPRGAASVLGVNPSTLRSRIKKLGI